MPEMTGTVTCLRVGPDAAFTKIQQQGTNETELFIVWWAGVTTELEPRVQERVAHTLWVSILREAMANNMLVTLIHPEDSGEVLNLQLGS